jgi:pyrroloquinoline quinone biosynthesis protein E
VRPGLAKGVRLVHDPVRAADALLYPEGTLLLSGPAPDVVRACDGRRSCEDMVAVLEETYEGVALSDIVGLVEDLTARHLLVDAGRPATVRTCATGTPGIGTSRGGGGGVGGVVRPVGMVAELTYRCPLRCGYCSNPVRVDPVRDELSTGEWVGVLDQGRALGVLQVHFSGGEPVLRNDLADLVGHARGLGMYTNLVTSGVGLSRGRLERLGAAGIDHVQLSVQHADVPAADAIAGLRAHEKKIAAAGLIRQADLPLTINVVLHAANVDALPDIAAFAAGLGADRLELAHTQYYGWGLRNRAALMPTTEQVRRATEAVAGVFERYGETMEIVYVEPDHYTGRVKPCMNGWGSRQFAVSPTGAVLPCLAAQQLPGPPPPDVRQWSLAAAWHDSELFNRFRGTGWMSDPCRSCALREVDFGGCRCQAFQLTGNAAATDPACALSPHHGLLTAPLSGAGPGVRPAVVPRRCR